MSTTTARREDSAGHLVLEERFAIVPEWLLDADISDLAVRLYAVLLRYGNSSGARMPSRATLARRLHKRSTDTVDRAMKELVRIGAVRIEHRYDGAQRLTNAYHLRSSRPGPVDTPTPDTGGSRRSAATRPSATRAGRRNAAGVAADSGHDPEHLTENTTSSPRPSGSTQAAAPAPASEADAAALCGVGDWPGFVADIARARKEVGRSATRWAGPCLAAALQLAVKGRDWPADLAGAALRQVAADPASRSPMRLAEAGPWWDTLPAPAPGTAERDELNAMTLALVEAGGVRVDLQMRARRDLEAQGLPVTRAAVIRGAYTLLEQHRRTGSASGAA